MLAVVVLIALSATAWYVVFSPDASARATSTEAAPEASPDEQSVMGTQSQEEHEES